MESLYPTGKPPIPRGTPAPPPAEATDKVNELFLPDGRRP